MACSGCVAPPDRDGVCSGSISRPKRTKFARRPADMKQLNRIFEEIGSTLLLLVSSLSYIGTLPRQRARFIEQCFMIGYTTLPIVAILSFFIGAVLALQAGYAM